MKVIDCKNLSFGYIKKPLCICDENFSLDLGKNLFIFGDKGAGKSTLLKLLCGMEEHYYGKIEICGKPPKESSRQISYLPSDLVALKNKTVIKNLQFACDQIGLPKESMEEDEWLKINGSKKVKKLSNIDKFIFAIKRAKLKNGALILLDFDSSKYAEEDLPKVKEIIENLLADPKRSVVLAIDNISYKKLQIEPDNSEICYLFCSKLQKFCNFDKFSSGINYLGEACYLQLENARAVVKFTPSGYLLLWGENTYKLEDEFATIISAYFSNFGDSADVVVFYPTGYKLPSMSQFLADTQSGKIMVFDYLSSERLGYFISSVSSPKPEK